MPGSFRYRCRYAVQAVTLVLELSIPRGGAIAPASKCALESWSETEGQTLLQRRTVPNVPRTRGANASTHSTFLAGEANASTTLSTFLEILESSSNFVKMDPKELCSKIVAPSGGGYHLDQPDKQSWSQIGQDELVDKVLGWNKDGFFIESGAADGETNSNTLFYEKKGWTGLLVEPDPVTFHKLLEKNRNAYAFNGALSTNGAIGTVGLRFADCAGYAGDGQCSQLSEDSSPDAVPVTMAPMEALLDCIGRKTIDFWSLDVEGVEHVILANTDFDTIEVGLMLIEMNKGDENDNGIMDTMTKYGFKELGRTDFDRIYINPSYFLNRGLSVPESI